MRLDVAHLKEPSPPWVTQLIASIEDCSFVKCRFRDAGITPRVLDARRMRTKDGLLDEFASRLAFPDYFGRNWDALSECLADLGWLDDLAYVLVITRAGCLLDAEPEGELAQFLELVNQVAAEWAKPVTHGEAWDRPAIPFHLVLQFSEVAVVSRLGLELDELIID